MHERGDKYHGSQMRTWQRNWATRLVYARLRYRNLQDQHQLVQTEKADMSKYKKPGLHRQKSCGRTIFVLCVCSWNRAKETLSLCVLVLFTRVYFCSSLLDGLDACLLFLCPLIWRYMKKKTSWRALTTLHTLCFLGRGTSSLRGLDMEAKYGATTTQPNADSRVSLLH